MKTKIVLWGTNDKDEKILLGIELLEKENKVKINVFPESEAKEDFYNQMLNDWRIDNPVVFPENHTVIERPLSVTDDLLPDEIKVTRTDVINRAKAEWHFVVLSAKLYELYKSEVSEFKEKAESLKDFDKNLWEELKTFWQKVQEQVYEKNLFREHAKELHDETNLIFEKLKEFRKKLDNDFQKVSKEKAKVFADKLEEIEGKIKEGLGLQPIWNEMKKIQANFRNENLARNDKNEIWNRIDAVFKNIKEKKYGSKQGGGKNNALERIENRYNGLMSAIKKMENSIRWDRKDLDFQGSRIEETYGQLEKEIRSAKLKMIEERIHSKETKLAEMLQTKVMLDDKIAIEKEKHNKIEQDQKVKEVEAQLKAKIKKEIKEKNKILDDKMGALGSTEEEANVPKVDKHEDKKEESKLDHVKAELKESAEVISEHITDTAEDILDTVKATAKVIGGRISKAIEELNDDE